MTDPRSAPPVPKGCMCGFVRHCPIHGDEHADVQPPVEMSADQLARIFEDLRAGADRQAAWQALNNEDRYTLYSLLLDLVDTRKS